MSLTAASISSGLPQMQRAAQYSPKTNAVSINEIPLPVPSDDQLLVKVAAASICHTDLMLFEPNEAGILLGDGKPITIGHEATGTILSVPKACTNTTLQFGARVGFLCPEGVCYECAGCQIHNSWCMKGQAVISGFGRDGFFQQYVVTNWRNAIVLPDVLDIYSSAPIFCAGLTAWHAVVKADIQPGEWMAVVGCGGLGQFGVQYATKLGYKVIGIDLGDAQLEEAKAGGAMHTFNPIKDKDYLEKIKELTGGGCHAAVNFTASKTSFDTIPDLLRIGGIMVVAGIPAQGINVSALGLALGKFRIAGASNGVPQTMGSCIEFSAKHSIKPHVTFYNLDQIQEMLDLMHSGKARGRLAVKFD